MKSPKSSQPPSRQGKRQMMVFLSARMALSVRNRAVRSEKTAQEMLAEAMNAVLESYGRKPVFIVGHQRFLRRKKGVAAPRADERTSQSRSGRSSISGWFDVGHLDYASKVACELGLTLQELAESGLKMMMKRKAVEPESKSDGVAR